MITLLKIVGIIIIYELLKELARWILCIFLFIKYLYEN